MTAKDQVFQQPVEAMAASRPPLLPAHELHAFVASYFNRRDHYLQIAKEHPAPIYLLESAVLRDRARRLIKAFGAVLPSVAYYYAVKSNNHPAVARVLLEEGLGLDVSSGSELQMALELDAEQIVFSGPGKTDPELHLAASHADRVVVLMDSLGELRRLDRIAAEHGVNMSCGVRLCTNSEGLWRKFGIALRDLSGFWEEARRCSHIQLRGLQFHVSWNLSPAPQSDFIGTLGRALAAMKPAINRQLEFIDIGGGYWPEQGEWLRAAAIAEKKPESQQAYPAGVIETHYRLPACDIEQFAATLGRAAHRHLFTAVSCQICIEPGRWLCNDAVQLLISVVDKKADDLVITDAGTNTVGWERYETDYCPILNLTRPSLDEKPCQILGSLCTPHDVWGVAYFGDDIQPGDLLLIPAQGAYTYSLRQDFIKPLPAFVAI